MTFFATPKLAARPVKHAVLWTGILSTLLLLTAGAALAAGPPCASPPCGGPPVPAAATVTVDCDQGDSVQDALATPADQLTVEIRGICHEDVVVERDNLVLSGRDPALDGLRGAATSTGFPSNVSHAVLRVSAAERVRVENLSIADGVRNGLQIEHSSQAVDVVGCEITDTARDGVQVTFDSTVVTIEDTAITGHGRAALSAFGADLVACLRCTLQGDDTGVLSVVGSRIVVTDSTVDGGQFGAFAGESGALVAATGSDVRSPVWGLAVQAGRVGLNGGGFEGSVLGLVNGRVSLNGATHDANAQGFNVLTTGSAVSAAGSTLAGFTVVEEFSDLVLRDGSVLAGDLACSLGGDAWCADPAVDVTGNASCGQCSSPAPAAPAAAVSLLPRRGPGPVTLPELPGFEP